MGTLTSAPGLVDCVRAAGTVEEHVVVAAAAAAAEAEAGCPAVAEETDCDPGTEEGGHVVAAAEVVDDEAAVAEEDRGDFAPI